MSTAPDGRLEERRNECLAQASEAEKLAHNAEPGLRDGYLSIARAWKQLADEIGRAIEERGHGGRTR